MQQLSRSEVVIQLSTGAYERKPVFSLPLGKYCSNLHTVPVSEYKFSLGLKRSVGVIIFCSEAPKIQGAGEPPFYHWHQCVLHYQLPVLISHARCQISREYRSCRPNPHTQYRLVTMLVKKKINMYRNVVVFPNKILKFHIQFCKYLHTPGGGGGKQGGCRDFQKGIKSRHAMQ